MSFAGMMVGQHQTDDAALYAVCVHLRIEGTAQNKFRSVEQWIERFWTSLGP